MRNRFPQIADAEKKPRFCARFYLFSGLFLRLLVLSMRPAPFAILLKLNFARDKLAVFARPVVDSVAL